MANLLELRVCFLLATTAAKNVSFKGTIYLEKGVELRLWENVFVPSAPFKIKVMGECIRSVSTF
jgi:hypothetical protein